MPGLSFWYGVALIKLFKHLSNWTRFKLKVSLLHKELRRSLCNCLISDEIVYDIGKKDEDGLTWWCEFIELKECEISSAAVIMKKAFACSK